MVERTQPMSEQSAELVRETRARRRIRLAIEAASYQIDPGYGIEWQPIGGMVEMQGREGGWTVFLVGGRVLCGYCVVDVLEHLALVRHSDGSACATAPPESS